LKRSLPNVIAVGVPVARVWLADPSSARGTITRIDDFTERSRAYEAAGLGGA
jgi:hypothetical protein